MQPFTQNRTADVAAAAAAADASGAYVKAPFAGNVTAVTIIPATLLTGANTESRTIQLFNRGQAGAGVVKVAEKAFTAGVNAPADDETSLTIITAGGADVVAEGDILEFVSLHVGATGLAAPAFKGYVDFARTSATG